jgi:hypothetical protein
MYKVPYFFPALIIFWTSRFREGVQLETPSFTYSQEKIIQVFEHLQSTISKPSHHQPTRSNFPTDCTSYHTGLQIFPTMNYCHIIHRMLFLHKTTSRRAYKMGHQKECCAKMDLGFKKEDVGSTILKPPLKPILIFL